MDVHDLNPDLPRDHMREVMRTCQPGKTFSVETVNCRADGTRFPVEVNSNAFRDGEQWLVVAVARDVTARVESERKLRASAETLKRQAAIDALTGLPNRDSILQNIETALQDAGEERGPTILYVDIDRFKVLNDLLGHTVGDRLLRAAAHRLRQCALGIAEVARYGSDEFVLLIKDSAADEQAHKLAQRITDAFACSFEHKDEEFVLTVSIGIARYPVHGAGARRLLHHANAAMFEAKRRGRQHLANVRTSIWRATWALACPWNRSLRLALENQELRLEYQPQFRWSTTPISGSRPCCAGTAAYWEKWHRRSSSNTRKIPAKSCVSAPGSSARHAASFGNGWTRA